MKKSLLLALLIVPLVSFGQSAEDFYNRGNAKYDLKDYKGSIADYTKSIELELDDADAYSVKEDLQSII